MLGRRSARGKMKKNIVMLVILILIISAYSEEIYFPPELNYWVDSIIGIVKDFDRTKFNLEDQWITNFSDFDFHDIAPEKEAKYPIFYRWNYSGNWIAYPFGMIELRKEGKKYSVAKDQHTWFYLFNKDKSDWFIDMPNENVQIDTCAWLNDNTVIAVGTEEENKKNNIVVIYYYVTDDYEVTVKKYIYEKQIKVSMFQEIKLKWYENRKDYFW